MIAINACSWDINDSSEAWYYPRTGSKLIVHETLTIAADSAALYIQHGRIMQGNYSRFDPYCKIRARHVLQAKQYILPGAFIITNSGLQTELIAGLSGLYISIDASIQPQLRVLISNSDAPSGITETIVMDLASVKQPKVVRLTCGGVEDHPGDAEPPTFAEIEETLGTIMSIIL